jgi:hypothetical protein
MKALAALLIAPAAFAAGFQAMYAMTPWACYHRQWSAILHVIPVLTLAGIASAFRLAMASWRAAGAGWPGESSSVHARDRFLGLAGMVFSAFLSLIALAQWLPVFLLSPCLGQ